MDLVQLNYFMVVAKSGHLTNAAKMLNVAQPALSVSIARLEKEVGVPLFDRVGRNISLNAYGEIFLNYVEQSLNTMKQAQLEIEKYSARMNNILTLGTVNRPLSGVMLATFKKLCPDCKIHQTSLDMNTIETELRKENVDYVISSYLPQGLGLVGEVFREEPMMLAVPLEHRFASREWIKLSEAKDEKFVNLPETTEYRRVTDDMCRDSGFEANVETECYHCDMPGLVALGAGVALVTAERAKYIKTVGNVVCVPLREPEYTRSQYIIWKSGRQFNNVAREFRKFIRRYFEDNNEDPKEACGMAKSAAEHKN